MKKILCYIIASVTYLSFNPTVLADDFVTMSGEIHVNCEPFTKEGSPGLRYLTCDLQPTFVLSPVINTTVPDVGDEVVPITSAVGAVPNVGKFIPSWEEAKQEFSDSNRNVVAIMLFALFFLVCVVIHRYGKRIWAWLLSQFDRVGNYIANLDKKNE